MDTTSLKYTYVKFPLTNDAGTDSYGAGIVLNTSANTCTILAYKSKQGGMTKLPDRQVSLHDIAPCVLRVGATCYHHQTKRWGTIVQHVKASHTHLNLYFVRFDEGVEIVQEKHVLVDYGDYESDPLDMMLKMEFHHPIWRYYRDAIVAIDADIRSTARGIAELVGSRVVLLAHQAEAVAQVLSDETCRYVLADEVGLGKTIEACVILKALRRYHPRMQTLIIVPSVLKQQWHYELTKRFWLGFDTTLRNYRGKNDTQGLLITHEALVRSDTLWEFVQHQAWGLVIADEVHQIKRETVLYERLQNLSRGSERVLLLSATPIQQRAAEYLDLLQLLNPQRYEAINFKHFNDVLQQQQPITKAVNYFNRELKSPADFIAEEFQDSIEPLIASLTHDSRLQGLYDGCLEAVAQNHQENAYDFARQVLAHLSQFYRIEQRMIRNRRASLDIPLPQRHLEMRFAYTPHKEERRVLEDLFMYADQHLQTHCASPLTGEYVRLLLSAAFSSPYALHDLLKRRYSRTTIEKVRSAAASIEQQQYLVRPVHPSEETERIHKIIDAMPLIDGEKTFLQVTLLPNIEHWLEATEAVIQDNNTQTNHRLVQVLHCVAEAMREAEDSKVLIFTSWLPTLKVVQEELRDMFSSQGFAVFHAELTEKQLGDEVDKFQRDKACRIMLTDELGGEGRNFQIADQIIHIDLPWSPARLEQRIGRVDRLGRVGDVISVVPYALETIESDLFNIWHKAFNLFEESMSGMEIALEHVQAQLLEALEHDIYNGLERCLGEMQQAAETIRKQVREERYYEMGNIDYSRRRTFKRLSDRYHDNNPLREPFVGWANCVGLNVQQLVGDPVLTINYRKLQKKKIVQAHIQLPDRSTGTEKLTSRIHGTFDRDFALTHEQVRFFAPGSNDPWVETITNHARYFERARCCALALPGAENWEGFGISFSLQVDPTPLFEAKYGEHQLSRIYEYLPESFQQVFVEINGAILSNDHPIVQRIQAMRDTDMLNASYFGDKQRSIESLKALFTADEWEEAVLRAVKQAEAYLSRVQTIRLDDARQAFETQRQGEAAASDWFTNEAHLRTEPHNLQPLYQHLLTCLENPIWQIESLCYYLIES